MDSNLSISYTSDDPKLAGPSSPLVPDAFLPTNPTLDTPPRAAYVGPANENLIVVVRWASITTRK